MYRYTQLALLFPEQVQVYFHPVFFLSVLPSYYDPQGTSLSITSFNNGSSPVISSSSS